MRRLVRAHDRRISVLLGTTQREAA
jgi:hypothetical protein